MDISTQFEYTFFYKLVFKQGVGLKNVFLLLQCLISSIEISIQSLFLWFIFGKFVIWYDEITIHIIFA